MEYNLKKSNKAKIEFEKMIQNNGHMIISGEYENNRTKVLLNFSCGHEPHWIKPNDYKSGYGCPKCGHELTAKKKSFKAKIELEKTIQDNGHVLLSEYQSDKERLLIDYKCGHEPHWAKPSFYKRGVRCPECALEKKMEYIENKKQKAKLRFEKMIQENGHVHVSGEYENNRTKILIDYKCGHDAHRIRPDDYIHGHGCPICKESKGEQIIRKWLEDNNIHYEAEYKLKDKLWRYDIYISSVNTIVEIHGSQHYKYHYVFHRTYEGFKQDQKRDKDKKEYAERLGYNYIVVDYREHKPELALERFINQFKRNEQLILF